MYVPRESGDATFLDDFSDMLLLKLLDVATRRSHDNDKVKSNAVRALGNLLRYLPQRSYSELPNTLNKKLVKVSHT